MTRVTRSKDCGNSPKNQFVETIAISFEKGDLRSVRSVLDDSASWSISGQDALEGEAIADRLLKRKEAKLSSVSVQHVVTHGKVGAVSGIVRHRSKQYDFCHVIEFTSAKCDSIKEMKSFGSFAEGI